MFRILMTHQDHRTEDLILRIASLFECVIGGRDADDYFWMEMKNEFLNFVKFKVVF